MGPRDLKDPAFDAVAVLSASAVTSFICEHRILTNVGKRLRVRLPDSELAQGERQTVAESTRMALREARSHHSLYELQAKSRAVRKSVEYSFPTAGLDS
jgi:hypothetical protein